MKFSNGYWLPKDGFQIHSAAQAYDVEVEENALSVFATSHVIRDRGDTLGGVVLNARYSAPMENVIKVRISHFEGGADGKVHFDLNEEKKLFAKNRSIGKMRLAHFGKTYSEYRTLQSLECRVHRRKRRHRDKVRISLHRIRAKKDAS